MSSIQYAALKMLILVNDLQKIHDADDVMTLPTDTEETI
jgi:hypothetical protein